MVEGLVAITIAEFNRLTRLSEHMIRDITTLDDGALELTCTCDKKFRQEGSDTFKHQLVFLMQQHQEHINENLR
jgi:hypothetical protein